jgi:hypothetical protein
MTYHIGPFDISSGTGHQGHLFGTVTDEAGGIVKSARIIITNTEKGVSHTLEANEAGDYVTLNLPLGIKRARFGIISLQRYEDE